MTSAELAQGLFRGAHIAAAMSVFGTATFRILVAAPTLSLLSAPGDVIQRFDRRATRLVLLALVIAVVAAGLWLLSQAASLAEEGGIEQIFATIPLVLFQTRFGSILILRLALMGAAVVLLIRARHAWGRWTATILAALAICLQTSLGHGASMGGALGWMLVAVEALHLLAAGAWLGGLIPLMLFLHGTPSHDAMAVVLRFSRLGIACVLALAVTIIMQSWNLVGGVPDFVGTTYGLLALLKLALFLALIGIAVLNRFRYTPALIGATGTAAKGRLQRSVAIETVVGVCAVLAAGVLLTQPPAMHEQPIWPFPYQFSLAAQADPDLRNETLLGATLAIVAFAFLCLAIAWRGGRLIMLAAAAGFAWWSWPHLSLLLVPAYPTSFYHSPTGFTAASIARGKELFAQHCTSCHGEEGRGDGPLARNLHIPPADLTAPHLFGHSDGEMFWWLSHGIEGPDGNLAMPGFADALEEDERWNLIDYVRAHNAGLAIAAGHEPPAPMMAPDITVKQGARSVPLSSLHGSLLIVAAVGDDGTAPPSLPPQDDVAITMTQIAPESDDWTAYAIAGGIAPSELAGTEFLVDADGWLRAVLRPDAELAWPRPDIVAASIKDAQSHPIGEMSGMHHH